jgi:hypothetical protein
VAGTAKDGGGPPLSDSRGTGLNQRPLASGWWPPIAFSVGVVGILLFAGALFGVIPPISGHPSETPPIDYVLTGISVVYQYRSISPIFGPNVSQACPECPLDLVTDSIVGFSYAQLNTTGQTKTILINVTLTATAPVFKLGGSRSSTYNYTEGLAVGEVLSAGVDLYAPTGPGLSFSISSWISVEVCGPPYCST